MLLRSFIREQRADNPHSKRMTVWVLCRKKGGPSGRLAASLKEGPGSVDSEVFGREMCACRVEIGISGGGDVEAGFQLGYERVSYKDLLLSTGFFPRLDFSRVFSHLLNIVRGQVYYSRSGFVPALRAYVSQQL